MPLFFEYFFLVMAPDNATKTTNAPTAEPRIFSMPLRRESLRIFNFICGPTNKIRPEIDALAFESWLISYDAERQSSGESTFTISLTTGPVSGS